MRLKTTLRNSRIISLGVTPELDKTCWSTGQDPKSPRGGEGSCHEAPKASSSEFKRQMVGERRQIRPPGNSTNPFKCEGRVVWLCLSDPYRSNPLYFPGVRLQAFQDGVNARTTTRGKPRAVLVNTDNGRPCRPAVVSGRGVCPRKGSRVRSRRKHQPSADTTRILGAFVEVSSAEAVMLLIPSLYRCLQSPVILRQG